MPGETRSNDLADLNETLCRLFCYRDTVQRKCANLGEMECRLLNLLTTLEEPVRMNSLSELLQVSDSRITRLIDTLVKKGLVDRTQSQQDRRVWQARISVAGNEATQHLSIQTGEIQRRLLARLPEGEIDNIFQSVQMYAELYRQVLQELENEFSNAGQFGRWQPQPEDKSC